MDSPENLKYTKEHEWIRIDGTIATVGITDFAQAQLGDIVYAELPDEGELINKGESFGVVESVKAVSDIYAPIAGEVVETNDPLSENPEVLNEDPYGEGWLIKVQVSDPSDLDSLMTSAEYEAFIKESHE